MKHLEICIASTNQGKVKEIRDFFSEKEQFVKIKSLLDFEAIPEPDEPFDNFLDNAVLKAKYYAQKTKMPALSEDAGLVIPSLDGFPGVYTKRFILENGSLSGAYRKLEELLHGKNMEARFICVAVLCIPESSELISAQGEMKGVLRFPARGNSGFGFDPVFVPQGYHQSIAELGLEVKNKISHRKTALENLWKKIHGGQDRTRTCDLLGVNQLL